jgi:signal transduction histidine kinase
MSADEEARERVRTEQGEHERAVRLQLLADVGQRTTAILSREELLRSAVHIIRETFQYFMVNIFLVEGAEIVLRACTMEELAVSVDRLHLPIGGEGITAWVAAHGKILTVPDVRRDPRYHYELEAELRTRSELAVPIVLKGVVTGVLDVQSELVGAFGELDEFTLQTVAGQLAVAIENARLYGELRVSLRELGAAQAQLLQSQKMEAVGRLAGGVAHDFNNQLTAIIGYAEILLAGCPENDPRRVELGEILKASSRAADLTRQLLAFSRKQVLRPRVVDLNALVEDMRVLLCRLLGEDVRLQTVYTAEPMRVRADPTQLQQVIMNLAVNARDAMPSGGTLTITTARAKSGAEAVAEGMRSPPGTWCVLRVTDTGTGMDMETLSRLFEPYFTTKERGKGTGLGLSTAYGIVRQSGGHIACFSEPGAGTQFTIHLPATAEDIEEAGGAPLSTPPVRGFETVLVVEDEPAVRELVRLSLMGSGYHVLTAGTGVEGMEILRSRHATIQLVITDMVLPGGVSGLDIARWVLDAGSGVRLLCVSGYSEQLVLGAESVLPRGSFLQKPFSQPELLLRVRAILDARFANRTQREPSS